MSQNNNHSYRFLLQIEEALIDEIINMTADQVIADFSEEGLDIETEARSVKEIFRAAAAATTSNLAQSTIYPPSDSDIVKPAEEAQPHQPQKPVAIAKTPRETESALPPQVQMVHRDDNRRLSIVRFPPGQPSPVRIGARDIGRLAANPNTTAYDLDVQRRRDVVLQDPERNLRAVVAIRAVGRSGHKLQACWIGGAIVELRADENNPEPRPLPLDGKWLQFELGSRVISDDLVSRHFELQLNDVDEGTEDGRNS